MSTPALPPALDPADARLATRAGGLLRRFNEAGVLAAADVHVAQRLARLAGVTDEPTLLAAALAVRGPRLGHVRVDLATIRETAAVDAEAAVDVGALPWPDSETWLPLVAACPLVATGEGADGADHPLLATGHGAREAGRTPLPTGEGADRPLRLVGSALYLDRYWREERRVAADLGALARTADDIDAGLLADGIMRLFPGEGDERQRLAAASAVLRRLAVVAGGPGTGKTTTVARIAALLFEQAITVGGPPPLVALAAPTGKAAARLQEAVRDGAADLAVAADVRERLRTLEASTLHRLLAWRPGSHSRFRHDRRSRLPHDVVIVDETSMVSLSLMARLVEAVRPGARLILVGDPGQLASIEAGVVLGDIVGPTGDGLQMSAGHRARLRVATGAPVAAVEPPAGARVADGIVVLDRVHRYGGAIARVADAIRAGDGDAVVAALRATPGAVTWLDADVAEPEGAGAVEAIRESVTAAARAVTSAARDGDAPAALEALGAFRLLCAHRRGPHGVAWWTGRIEAWLAEEGAGVPSDGGWYPGRPLLVTENDHGLRLYNGDTGVVVTTPDGRVGAAFDRGGAPVVLRPGRLAAVETVYAMTIHKSQGSQFGAAAVLLPPAGSPLLTRELLYTAVTRARERLLVAGAEDSLRAAVARPVARASGLRERLWGAGPRRDD